MIWSTRCGGSIVRVGCLEAEVDFVNGDAEQVGQWASERRRGSLRVGLIRAGRKRQQNWTKEGRKLTYGEEDLCGVHVRNDGKWL